MNILLISPRYDATIVAPHLGLGYLSSSLKKRGHKIKILDGTREKIEYNPEDWELVGVTAMSTYFPEACKDIEKAKAEIKNKMDDYKLVYKSGNWLVYDLASG